MVGISYSVRAGLKVDGKGNIVRSIDIRAEKEYTYTYENEKITRATECDISIGDNEIIIGKTLVNSILYSYDPDGKLTKKRIVPAQGTEQTVYYEYSGENEDNTVVKLEVNGKTVTSHSKTDAFGRKVFDELQLGTGFVSRQFSYHAGEATDEHKDAEKLKSSATTQLVSQIILSDGRTLSYEYDAEERITKVVDSIDGTTEYTYDSLGQLLTETVRKGDVAKTVNAMAYDSYGNIVQKNGVNYVYDEVWKDLLKFYDGTEIIYDAQGNPTNYLGHNLSWEKGRQLKSFDNITYTYNANGIRTSKTVAGIKYTYTLDGTKILRETWNDNVLETLYDNEDAVCGIIYNGAQYYFLKNLQGDIIAITDRNGDVVARYSYDAWGKCTITESIGSHGNIASINPYRYRGYYFDEETGLYYLQSRYYDPELGRFLNVDNCEVLCDHFDTKLTDLFAYCENNPVTGSDVSGTMIVRKICGVFLSAVFGILLQLFVDFAIFLARKLIYGKNVAFNPKPGDYVEQALSWGISYLNPFSKKKRIIAEFVAALLLSIINQVVNLISGYGFSLRDILGDAAIAAVSLAVNKILNKSTAREIKKLKKHYTTRMKAFKPKEMKIKAKYKILGQRINLAIQIPANIIGFVQSVIAKC